MEPRRSVDRAADVAVVHGNAVSLLRKVSTTYVTLQYLERAIELQTENLDVFRQPIDVPKDVTLATKPQLALKMLKRAFEAGCRPAFVLAAEVYGATASSGDESRRVYEIARATLASAWHRLSVGAGAKGPRVYDWAAA